ncbi:HD domain-containing protein [Microbacterium stercoris]|uniref:HD domain-containing protein n=1 Tax=Microbacterium stercoris TaxID=2820289 RepID=A0A939TW05_9MICO|nr:HD domain-containing protein [Microbacterium stercoris]MBO3662132.1 HD domain-containing protein [Microbacterium stercoris]
MTEIIAGVAIPDSAIANAAARKVSEAVSPLLFHHSRRTFLFAALHARRLGTPVDHELLYIASLFHDIGLSQPAGATPQRFELDGADHARAFLREHGASDAEIETVWMAIALHTTPGIPDRLAPEIALTHAGIVTDVVGLGLQDVPAAARAEILAAHPREEFETGFLHALHEGIRHRPETAYGTINADVLSRFSPDVPQPDLIERVLHSGWTR